MTGKRGAVRRFGNDSREVCDDRVVGMAEMMKIRNEKVQIWRALKFEPGMSGIIADGQT